MRLPEKASAKSIQNGIAEILVGWRKRWAALANQYLLEAGQRELIDARAGAESGRALDLRPAGASSRGAEDAEIAWRNGERIVAEPVWCWLH